MIQALLRALAGLLAWAAAFALLYGMNGLLCSAAVRAQLTLSPHAERVLLIVIWLAALAGLAVLCRRLWLARDGNSLLDWLAPVLAGVGLGSTLFTGFPVLMTTICAP